MTPFIKSAKDAIKLECFIGKGLDREDLEVVISEKISEIVEADLEYHRNAAIQNINEVMNVVGGLYDEPEWANNSICTLKGAVSVIPKNTLHHLKLAYSGVWHVREGIEASGRKEGFAYQAKKIAISTLRKTEDILQRCIMTEAEIKAEYAKYAEKIISMLD